MSLPSHESQLDDNQRRFDHVRDLFKSRAARIVLGGILGVAIASPADVYAYEAAAGAAQSTDIGPPLTSKAFKDFSASCDGGAVINGLGGAHPSNPRYNSTCYYWAGADQQNNGRLSARGVSAVFTQNNPEVGKSPTNTLNHSLGEIWAGSSHGGQAIEVGWIKNSGDTSPHLFATHWVNGTFAGYANVNGGNNGFINSNSRMQVGDAVKVGARGEYGIKFSPSEDAWQILDDNKVVGDFPESLWKQRGASFKSIGEVTIYGEVALSKGTTQPTEMGGGANLAGVEDYRLYGSTTPADFSNFYAPQSNAEPYYKLVRPFELSHQTYATSFMYGGEGKINVMQQEAHAVW
jgi:hypothetical protein